MNKTLENIIYKLLFTCEKATLLIEKKASGQSIGIINNLRLMGHLSICKWCRAYNKKVTIIEGALVRISEKSKDDIEEAEMNAFKNQLLETTLKEN